MKVFKKLTLAFLSLGIILSFSSCNALKNANNKQKGAVIGTAAGGVLGAVIGNNAGKGGNSKLGTVIGGVVGGAAGVLIGKRMDDQAKKIEEEIPGVDVERVDDGIVVTFDENSGVRFKFDSFELTTEAQTLLNKFVGVLKEYPDTNLLVAGHTDSSGKAAYNMKLSKNRANAVTKYLTAKGINTGRFTTVWYGEEQPKFDNSTPEGRAKNRRVNIGIVPNEKMKKDAEQQASQGNN